MNINEPRVETEQFMLKISPTTQKSTNIPTQKSALFPGAPASSVWAAGIQYNVRRSKKIKGKQP